jgi:ribosomal-protein-alanine N-acetyltransferase
MLAIIDRKSNEFIGQCGLLTQEVDGEKELEIGYSLIKKHWGKDLATEVAIHLRNWASKNSDINSIISIIKSDTEASKSVANKLGMKYDQELVWKEIEVTIFRINNPNSDL